MPFPDYYTNLRPFIDSVLSRAYGPLDSNRLPLTNYGGRIGLQYNPTTIAQFGLGNYQYYLDSPAINQKNLALFNSAVSWISRNFFEKEDLIYWLYYFDWPIEGLKHPWHSGLSQGLCISVLVRAYFETGISSYLDLAIGGFNVLNTEVKNGGAMSKDGSNVWIEEYPNNHPAHVLNGFIYAIFSLFDLSHVTSNHEITNLLNNSMITLKKNLKFFDLKYWSAYDLGLKCPVSKTYQELHVDQLRSLYALTGENIFLEYSNKWERYLKNPKSLFKSQVVYYYKSINTFIEKLGLKRAFQEGTIALLQHLRKKQ